MNAKEFKEYILTQMTADEALTKFLEGQMGSYEKLKFEKGEEVHPIFIISMAAMDLGWCISIPKTESDDDVIQGMVVGTTEYMDEMLSEDDENGCSCKNGCSSSNCQNR